MFYDHAAASMEEVTEEDHERFRASILVELHKLRECPGLPSIAWSALRHNALQGTMHCLYPMPLHASNAGACRP